MRDAEFIDEKGLDHFYIKVLLAKLSPVLYTDSLQSKYTEGASIQVKQPLWNEKVSNFQKTPQIVLHLKSLYSERDNVILLRKITQIRVPPKDVKNE